MKNSILGYAARGSLLRFSDRRSGWPRNERNLPTGVKRAEWDPLCTQGYTLVPPFLCVPKDAVSMLVSSRAGVTVRGLAFLPILVNTVNDDLRILWAPIDDLILL